MRGAQSSVQFSRIAAMAGPLMAFPSMNAWRLRSV
jgi:hypothetical protein